MPPARSRRKPLPPGVTLEREAYMHLAEAIVDQIGLEIVTIDPEGRVRGINRNAAKRLPDPAGAVGRPLAEAFPMFARSEGGVSWKAAIFENVLREERTVAIRDVPVGGRHFEVRIFPLRVGKRRVGAAIILDDVTDKVQRQGEQVRQAKTLSLANLAASIAHEIRNPLNSIALNIQLLKEDLEKSGAAAGAASGRTIDVTLHGIERLNRIIKDFLQFARPPQVAPRMDDPNGAILSALQLLDGQIRKAGVDVTVDLAPLPRILMDADRLSEAIYNLALNAIQAMERGPRRILRVTSRLDADCVVIRIQDSGPGIPPEVLPRIFDLFFTTREGGTGLGLPYAEGIVKAHQGRIEVESAPGHGSTFSVALPASILMSKGG